MFDLALAPLKQSGGCPLCKGIGSISNRLLWLPTALSLVLHGKLQTDRQCNDIASLLEMYAGWCLAVVSAPDAAAA
jgi:hypothetical protein